MRTPWISASIVVLLSLVGCGSASTWAPCEVARARPSISAAEPSAGSPRLVAKAGARASGVVALADEEGRTIAFVADEEGRAIVAFDLETQRAIATTEIDGPPAELLVLADGRIAVTLRDVGRVVILEAAHGAAKPLVERHRAEVPAEPIALAVTPDGAELLVASGWSHRLSAFDARTLAPEWNIDLPREPRAVVIEDHGETAFVSHAIGSQLSEIDLRWHGVTPIDLHRDGVVVGWNGGEVRDAGQGYALVHATIAARPDASPRGMLFAPGASIEPGKGVVSTKVYGPAGGAPVLPVVHVVDEERGALVTRSGGDPESVVARRCNLPRAAALAKTSLYVACLGVDAVLELDARAADPMTLELRRFAVPAGPTGLAIDEARERAVVWSAFAHRLSIIDLNHESKAKSIASLEAPARPTWLAGRLARGRELFHATRDHRISGDGRACASCHADGREDGMVWATPAGPRQTIMLAGRVAGTAPFGWTGARKELTGHIRDTWHRLGGDGVFSPADREDLESLAAYVMSMKAPPRASLSVDRSVVERGRELFEAPAQGCGSCHLGGGSDGLAHDVGSDAFHRPFDTPSLRFVGQTGPYFHDGRYADLDELLEKTDGKMGHTSHLSDEDRRALVAYLEAL